MSLHGNQSLFFMSSVLPHNSLFTGKVPKAFLLLNCGPGAAALNGEEPVSSRVEFLSATLTPLAPAAVISSLCSEATNITLSMDWVILLCFIY